MMQSEYDFCTKYISEFLAIINYPVDDNTIELIERFRNQELYKIEQKYGKSPMANALISVTNADYDKQIFDYIKENVADVDRMFFNERITNMKRLLMTNRDYALRLGMKIYVEVIDDFYNNYLIALERTLRAGINPNLK